MSPSPRQQHRRRQRQLSALAALGAGAANLWLAASTSVPIKGRSFGLRAAADVVFGARYGLLVAGLALILTIRGLLHGKRNAWLVGLLAAIASIPGHHLKDADLVGLTTSTVTITILLLCWRAFGARSDPGLARQGLELLLLGELATFVYGTSVLYVLDAEFRRPTTIVRSVSSAVRLMFLLPVSLEPISRHGRWLVDSVRVAALVVALTALTRIVATVVARPVQRERHLAAVTRLLDTYATNDVAYFQLLDDKIWFTAADGEAFIGYKLVGTVALALGDPIGASPATTAVTAEFLELCEGNGWAPAFHQVTEAGAATLQAAGLKLLKIGEEAIVDLKSWDLGGRSFKTLRSALRRVERAGCHLVTFQPPLDDDTIERLRAVSDAWLASGNHRERTFTLGCFDANQLRQTAVIAVEEEGAEGGVGRLVAFANLLPSYQSPNGTFDLMRRSPEAPNGVMEFLFVGLIDHFRAEGREGLNLGLAPASGIVGNGLPDRALRLLYERGGAAFNFDGLRSFKEKWQPRWEPRYLAYRTDSELLRVAAAVARAGELPDTDALVTRLARVGRRYPFSVAVVFVAAWLMGVNAADRDTYRQLLRHLALRWDDLVHLQLWRLPTAELLQAKPGWQIGMLAAVAIIVPLAERRFGSLRTIVLFFAGDGLSTVPILVGMRVAAALGSHTAAHTLTVRDCGTSSALWALAGAFGWSMKRGKLRTAILGAEALLLVVELVWLQRLSEIQHPLAAAAGIAVLLAPATFGKLRHRSCRTA